jgi:hypothetical protein
MKKENCFNFKPGETKIFKHFKFKFIILVSNVSMTPGGNVINLFYFSPALGLNKLVYLSLVSYVRIVLQAKSLQTCL